MLTSFLHRNLGIADHSAQNRYALRYLKRRINELGLNSFTEYRELVESTQHEQQHFFNLVTNNKTHFFRERIQLDYLYETLFPQLEQQCKKDRRIRVWSAACSTGEEAYTLAMLLNDYFGDEWDIKVLASDINTEVLFKAKHGKYHKKQASEINPHFFNRYLTSVEGSDKISIVPEIRSIVQFRQINLASNSFSLIKTRFDLILCRNVAIYFTSDTIKRLLGHFHKMLNEHGSLVLGIAESLNVPIQFFKKHRFNTYSPTYQAMSRRTPLIAIGGSTGAVQTTEHLLRQLPIDTPGIVVAIHMPHGHSENFAKRLDRHVSMRVREAKSGDAVIHGRVLISPGDKNITIIENGSGEYVVELDQEQQMFTPSVNQLFRSISEVAKENAVGVLLTGMGDDGAEGMLQMRTCGARTITQDKESSIVFGMPKAAIEQGASELTVSISEIPSAILQATKLIGKGDHSERLRKWKSQQKEEDVV